METDPAIGTDFFAREEIISIFNKRLSAFRKGYRQNIGLLGKSRIGKSSTILQFILSLKDPDIVPIYVEILPEPLEYFTQRFMGAILYGYLKSQSKEVPGELNQLISLCKKLVPNTLKRMRYVKKALNKGLFDKAFNELLSLTSALKHETGKKIILVFDNFDNFDKFFISDPYNRLGKEIMVQKDTMYIVASSKLNKAKNIFREKLSLLFGNFEILELEPFDFDTCRNFIRHKLNDVRIQPLYEGFLVQISDGHPYYLNTILQRISILTKLKNRKILDENIISEALEGELFERNGTLYQYFINKINIIGKTRYSLIYLNTMVALALDCRKLTSISRYLNRRMIEVKKILLRLLEEEAINKRGSFYFLDDPLFNFWLKNVYHKQRVNLDLDRNRCRDAFYSEIRKLIDYYIAEERKEIPKRIEELLKKFENDVIELNQKKIKCPSFSDVLYKPSNGRVFPVEARSTNTRWMCQVAHEKVCEDDITRFITDIKKVRKKVHRKILITLAGMDLNAKIMAKQAKIAVWNLKNLNFLLDLYGKAKILL